MKYIVEIINRGKFRVFIRNNASPFIALDYPIFAIVWDRKRDRNELKFGMFGWYLIFMKVKY